MPTEAPPLPSGDRPWALFLDVDGTLLEIAETPDEATAPPELLGLLERLETSLDGAVALVSGREIAALDEIFHPLTTAAAGLHGLERRTSSSRVVLHDGPFERLRDARRRLDEFVRRHPGASVEDKGRALALHYRGAPKAAEEALAEAKRIVDDLGSPFELQPGKMVVEIKTDAACKGRSIQDFLAEEPFAGRRPIFAGDDRTDEDGFEAVNRLGGVSIRIGGESPTAAQHRLADPTALRDWLERVIEAVDPAGGHEP